MPHYYFDAIINGESVTDLDGDELASNDEAIAYVRRFFVEQLPSLLAHGFEGEMRVQVRDAAGPHFRVRLSVEVE